MTDVTETESRTLPPRREAFCRHVSAGRSLAAAARLAGYAWVGAKQQGWRLIREPEVAARIAELGARREAQRLAEVDRFVEAARTIFEGASLKGNHAVALRALEMMARLGGALETPAQVAALEAADYPEEEVFLEDMELEGSLPEPQPDEPAPAMPPELPATLPALRPAFLAPAAPALAVPAPAVPAPAAPAPAGRPGGARDADPAGQQWSALPPAGHGR
jgi:hypothetical protein